MDPFIAQQAVAALLGHADFGLNSVDGVPVGYTIGETYTPLTELDGFQAAYDAAANPVPTVVSGVAARYVLKITPSTDGQSASLYDQIKSAIALLPDPPRAIATDALETAAEFNRDGYLITTLADDVGLTTAQIDALFRASAAIKL